MRIISLAVVVAWGTAVLHAEDWPQFRGPTGQGHSSETGVPERWSESENVRWKVLVPGFGWSSPAVVGNQIWLTSATEEGKSLRAICLDKQTGEIRHNVEVFRHADPGKIHSKNSYASPTPIIDADKVYIHFGALGTAALNTTTGEILWTKVLEYYHRHGPGGSPQLYRDRLIINCDGFDEQFVVALSTNTGEELWRARRDAQHAYSTPLWIEVDGKDQIISTGADRTVAYDPMTGKEIWWFTYEGYSLVPRPVYGHGLVFVCSGYNTPWVYAVRPTGQNDVTKSHVVWSLRRGAPLTPSPLLVGDELYLMTDRGVASCVDARTGKVHWQERLGGDYSASPTFVDGRIYIQSESGVTTVIAPGTEYRQLAQNKIDGRTFASLAISDQAIFLRSDTHLYRIEHERK